MTRRILVEVRIPLSLLQEDLLDADVVDLDDDLGFRELVEKAVQEGDYTITEVLKPSK